MNAFHSARGIEQEAWRKLRPFLSARTDDRYVLIDKGPQAKRLQEEIGDVIANVGGNGRAVTIELKAEEKDTGNLFLETWSNRNLDNRLSHAERGSNMGWFFKTKADLLWYYFLQTDRLIICDLFTLKRILLAPVERKGRGLEPWPLLGWEEKRQNKYEQLNDTWGVCAPITALQKVLGAGQLKVTTGRQISMFDEGYFDDSP